MGGETRPSSNNITMLKIEIISPAGVIFEGPCSLAVVPSAAGEIGVMEDHEAFVAQLKAGTVSVFNEKQELLKAIEVAGGFAEIHDGKMLKVLIDS